MLGVDKLGWLMPERTNAVVESGALGCWFVDWMKGAGCVDRVVWWVADERNDVPGGGRVRLRLVEQLKGLKR